MKTKILNVMFVVALWRCLCLMWFVVQFPDILCPNRTCLRCVLPKCLMSQRSPSLFPPRRRPSTLPPPIDKPRLFLLSRKTIAPVPPSRSPPRETQNTKGNSDWLSYRNRLEDGKWRGREAYETRQVGGPRRTALPNVGECWNTERQMSKLLSFHLLRPQLCVCFCPVAQSCPWAARSTLAAPSQQAQEEREGQEGEGEGEEERKAQEEDGSRGSCGDTSNCRASDF